MLKQVGLCAALAFLLILQGCTVHFKATDVELDAERQRIQDNVTYELEKVVVFGGETCDY